MAEIKQKLKTPRVPNYIIIDNGLGALALTGLLIVKIKTYKLLERRKR